MNSSSSTLFSISFTTEASGIRCPPTMGPSVRFRPMRVSASCAAAERLPGTLSSRPIASPSSLYALLCIRSGASCQEIKAAYRRLARVLHPDVAPALSGEFMRVHEAYETLYDPGMRADYDRAMLVGPHASPVRSRKWETDQCW